MPDSARPFFSNLSATKKLRIVGACVVILLLLLEGAARLWLDRFPPKIDMAAIYEDFALYIPDRDLFWKMRSNSSFDVENVVYRMRDEALNWHFETNAVGHRGAPYPATSTAPVIVALGDSSTFGFRVDDDDTYPSQLQRALREKGLPGATVVNYGVPGYSSFQGRRLLEEILAHNQPDVVLLSFGASDQEDDKFSDAQKAERLAAANQELSDYFNRLGIIRFFQRPPHFDRGPPANRSKLPARVSPKEFRANLQAMIELIERSGARAILLDLVFVEPVLGEVMASLAREQGLPRIEGRTLLRDALLELLEGRRFQAEREARERFWKDEIKKYRPLYYPPAFYEELFADPVWNGLLLFFLVDPIHPGALGHQVIAEALAQIIHEDL